MEHLLHRLWREELTLGPEDVGIHDHFADLGGKSLHAVALLARLEAVAGLHLHAALLAAHPTIAALAAYIDQHPALVRAAGGSRKKPFAG
jgi:surfactin family lipopeptide synthetase B